MGNYFYKTQSSPFIYSPAELAIINFNFEDAIEKKYHTFINPGTNLKSFFMNDRQKCTER